MNAIDFWKRINKRIKELNITQESLCSDLGINLGTFKQQITHARFPSVDSAFKIARALGVSVEYLVTGEDTDEKSKILKEMQSVIDRFS